MASLVALHQLSPLLMSSYVCLKKRSLGPNHSFHVVLELPVVNLPSLSRKADAPWPSPSGQPPSSRTCHCAREPQGGPSQWGREPGELPSQRPRRCRGKGHSKGERVTAPRSGLRSCASCVALHLVILVVPSSCCSREMFSRSDNTENKKANNNIPVIDT